MLSPVTAAWPVPLTRSFTTRDFGAVFGTPTAGFWASAGGGFGVVVVWGVTAAVLWAAVRPADGAGVTPGAFELPQAASTRASAAPVAAAVRVVVAWRR